MTKINLLAAMVFVSLVASTSWAGRESGGGEVYGDTLNPWFLENTVNVSYCIEVDSANFGAPAVTLDSIVDSAIAQWKSAFANARANETVDKNIEPYGMVRIATQNFIKEDCTPSTMIRFQFGVLTNEQRSQFLSTPTQVIAETIRTSYDEVNLRGRGFIYFAPDSGSLRPTGLKMAKHPWSFMDGLVLKRVLLHELGHLFGLSHSGNAYSLMGQDHPEYIVQQSTIESLSKQPAIAIEKELNRIGIFGFEFPSEQENCLSESTIVLGGREQDQFFGIPEGAKCRKIIFSRDGFEVYASIGAGQPYSLIGRSATATSQGEILQPVLRVKISKEQKIFNRIPLQAQATGYIAGPMAVSRRAIKTTYQSSDGLRSGEVKSVFLPSQQLQMDAVFNGKFVEIFE